MLKVLNICDTPMAFYYQRQSAIINDFLGDKYWRYYYDDYRTAGCQYFIDLADFNTREEVMAALCYADCYIFHATRNYMRPLYCRDGVIRSSDYPKGKAMFILIHGQPETLQITRTNLFIKQHAPHVQFLVATPNQLNLFPGTRLFPIVGQFRSTDTAYTPRKDYDMKSSNVRIIRRNEWKAATVTSFLLNEIGMRKSLPKQSIEQKLITFAKRLLHSGDGRLPQREFVAFKNGLQFTLDNRTYWQDLQHVLEDIRESDILLENEWRDYPGGGCNHTIGMEAMSLGVACFNGITKANAARLSEWLGADRLPPLPNWENEEHYRKSFKEYLRTLIYDHDYRVEVKRSSREFFITWLDAPNVVPRTLRELGAAI